MPADSAIDADDLSGRNLAGYRVLRRLGAGGMAEVYLALQQSLQRQVALKVLQRQLEKDRGYVDRFQREAQAAASLVHANIVQIYEVGCADGVHFIAQEYVRGRNLAQILKREASLPPRMVLDVLRQVTAALAKASELGIVHRDIKPENILVNQSGEVKVADFGLARVQSADAQTLTQAGVTMGTPLYMSPEQIEGRHVDARSDIYSLGITAYHLLAGAPPHAGETALAIAVQHLNAAPRSLMEVRPDIPAPLAKLVHMMIAKRPEDRPQSASELLADLRRLAAESADPGWDAPIFDWSGDSLATPLPSGAAGDKKLARGWGRGIWRDRRVRYTAAALALGVLLGILSRPKFLLSQSAPPAEVEKLDSEWAQLAHANLAPSEESWKAVAAYFPDADEYIKDLATEGLIRYHLFLMQDFRRALDVLEAWPEPAGNDPAMEPLRTFREASLVIVQQRLGDSGQARRAASRLGDRKNQLRRSDPRLYELLQKSLAELGLPE